MNISEKTKNILMYVILAILFIVVSGTVAATVVVNKNKQVASDYYNKKCAAFEMQNYNSAIGQIVFIGDSITDGFVLDNYYAGYPLATYNRGIGGDSTAGVLKRLNVSAFDLAPTKIVLMIGINDINGGLSKTTIVKNYEEILSRISENLPSTEVYCMSILPVNETLNKHLNVDVKKINNTVRDVNKEIDKLAIKFNYTYVNLFPYFSDENDMLHEKYSVDGVHLTDAAYRVWSHHLKGIWNL